MVKPGTIVRDHVWAARQAEPLRGLEGSTGLRVVTAFGAVLRAFDRLGILKPPALE